MSELRPIRGDRAGKGSEGLKPPQGGSGTAPPTVTVGRVTAASLKKRAAERAVQIEAEREKKMKFNFELKVVGLMNDVLGCAERSSEEGRYTCDVMVDRKYNDDMAMEVCARLRHSPYLFNASYDNQTITVKWDDA